jgi:proline iminopeptidase
MVDDAPTDPRYPEIEPYAEGFLDTTDGQRIHWETSGSPDGKPAVVFHGGPGSGIGPWSRRLFDPVAFRIVQFDQRGCGLSTPSAGAPDADLSTNRTDRLLDDIERLREHLGIERWLVQGASWGSTLALAYAEAHPARVSELIVWGVTTGRWSEFDWVFGGGVSVLFPAEWERLVQALPELVPDREVPAAYQRLLFDPDPAVQAKAALDWCTFDSASPDWPPSTGLDEMYEDPAFRLVSARLVTHYASHYGFLEDDQLIRGASALSGIDGAIIQGRFDFAAPLGNAWTLHRAGPRAAFTVITDAGHHSNDAMRAALVAATDRFATR